MFKVIKARLKFIISTILGFYIIACSSQEYTTAKLAIQQSEWSKVEEWLPKAMAVEPDNPEIPIVYAIEVHARNGDWQGMYDMFQKALAIDANKKVEIRAVFLPVSDQVNNYTQYYWAEEFNKGVEKFKEIQEDPDNRTIYLGEAIEYFISASIINPNDPQTYTTLSKCYLDLDDKDNAMKFIKTAVEKDPEGFNSNFSAGQILLRCGMGSEVVIPYYEKAVQIEPSNSNALRELASMYYDLGNKEKSIKVFNDAIQNEEDKIIKADLFFNLGVIHNQMENYEEAEKSFDEAYYLNEDDFEAALGMASAYEGLGDKYFNGSDGFTKDFELAVRWYRKAEKKIKDVKSIDFENAAQFLEALTTFPFSKVNSMSSKAIP